MLKDAISKLNYKFLIIFVAGIILRIIYFIGFYPVVYPDTQNYIEAAQMYLEIKYYSFREPVFPFFAFVILLFTNDPILSVKLVSVISGILSIYASYFVFKKASLKIFKEDVNKEQKSEYIGLLVSLCYSIDNDLAFNSVMGLREELITLILLLVIYFVFIKDDNNSLKDKIIIVLLFTILTFLHLTASIFTSLAIIIGFFILKVKFFKLNFNTSFFKVLLIILTTTICLSIWFLHCAIVNNDPFFTINDNRTYFRENRNFKDDSFQSLLKSILNGFQYGIFNEFSIISSYISLVFALLAVLSILKFYDTKIVFFLGIILILNFVYLSPFIAVYKSSRLILYFKPFVFFLGWLIIIDIWLKNTEKRTLKLSIFEREIHIPFIFLFVLMNVFLIFAYLFENINYIILNVFQSDEIGLLNDLEHNFIVIFNIILMAIIILPYLYDRGDYVK